MTPRRTVAAAILIAACAVGAGAGAQQATFDADVNETKDELARARGQGAQARERAERLEAEARRASEVAEKTAREAAAVAARIQETEARVAAIEARAALVGRQRERLVARLAERQRPLVRLTAALQRLARRPPVLALFRPGSVRDTMHTRALLETMIPEVDRRTAVLRKDIARARELERQALAAATELRQAEAELETRRKRLATVETRQRLASREANSVADRESERALALAERARDLDMLVDDLEESGARRRQLAALPGPVLRPDRPHEARVAEPAPASPTPAAIEGYMLPVAGRLVSGFNDASGGTARSRGITLLARGGAQVVAPAAGRVAFAGPYRGFGRIVIIEHDGGWTTLVTGLVQLDTAVGRTLVAGAPLGIAGPGRPQVTLELRREGTPVNPLLYLASL